MFRTARRYVSTWFARIQGQNQSSSTDGIVIAIETASLACTLVQVPIDNANMETPSSGF